VQVCPTGIDIRNGLQVECIACTACIDACDSVMDRIDRPRGLIRYATERGLAEGSDRAQMWRRVLRPRVLIYGAVLVLIAGGFAASLALRSPLKVDVVRDRASLARLVEDGAIENVYRLQLMNASEVPRRLHVEVQGLPGAVLADRAELPLAPAEARWFVLHVRMAPEAALAAGPGAHPLRFRVSTGTPGARAVTEKSTFIVPR
jgi:polyferredoxin